VTVACGPWRCIFLMIQSCGGYFKIRRRCGLLEIRPRHSRFLCLFRVVAYFSRFDNPPLTLPLSPSASATTAPPESTSPPSTPTTSSAAPIALPRIPARLAAAVATSSQRR
jgi:hypothetical protein